VDGQTAEDGTVTVRERDSMLRQRISEEKVIDYLHDQLTID
jgi:glycyl-tRNA synthetase (class II)